MQRTAVGRLWLGSRRDRGAEACPAGRSLAFGDCFFCWCLLLSRMFVCFFSFYKCQPTSHSSWQPGTAVGADPVPEGQPLLGAFLWTWKVVTLWDGALLTIHILLQAHRARSQASNCPMPPLTGPFRTRGEEPRWRSLPVTEASRHSALSIRPCRSHPVQTDPETLFTSCGMSPLSVEGARETWPGEGSGLAFPASLLRGGQNHHLQSTQAAASPSTQKWQLCSFGSSVRFSP